MSKNNDEKFNVMTLGNSTVGKTSFILMLVEGTFTDIHLATYGIDYKSKTLTLPNKKSYKVNIYDTAGQERYQSISLNTIKNADGIILMYDITNKSSFDSISNWMKGIKEIKGDNFPIVLIGNKCDLESTRVISKEKGEELANLYKISFFETSNKNKVNIEQSFSEIVNIIIKYKENKNENKCNIKLNKNTNKNKSNCSC